MANDFVRNIKGVRNVDNLSKNITTENDLISTSDGEVYVVTNKGYSKITGVETKEIKQLKTDVANVKIQSDSNTLSISGNTDDIETNTSEIETLKTLTENNTSEDSDWVPFQLINGAKSNSAYGYGTDRNGFGCAYRTIKRGDVTERHLRINGSNVTNGQVIAQLPDNFSKRPQVGFIRAPLVHNGTSIIIENNGEIKVYIANDTAWEKSDSKYIYGTISWVE